MSWISAHKKEWRAAALVLLPLAIVGPWWFDRIYVPAEYTCSPPNYRLEGDFCGVPVTGLWFFLAGIPAFVRTSWELVLGEMTWRDWFRALLFCLSTLLLLLPLISTLLLMARSDRPCRQVFSIVAWVLATGIGLLIGLSSYSRLFWVLWGVWLYIVLAVSALILEVLTMVGYRRLCRRL